jgi:hypothetical protein
MTTSKPSVLLLVYHLCSEGNFDLDYRVRTPFLIGERFAAACCPPTPYEGRAKQTVCPSKRKRKLSCKKTSDGDQIIPVCRSADWASGLTPLMGPYRVQNLRSSHNASKEGRRIR